MKFRIKNLQDLIDYANGFKQFNIINGVELPEGYSIEMPISRDFMKSVIFELDSFIGLSPRKISYLETEKLEINVLGINFKLFCPKQPEAHVAVKITSTNLFRAIIKVEGHETYEVTIGGTEWGKGKGKEYSEIIQKKCYSILNTLQLELDKAFGTDK